MNSKESSDTPAASRPFVLLNLAMTADGKITTANRAVGSFSSRRDREHMMELRATVDAVMAGARTVDLNPVNLGPGAAKYRRQRVKAGLAEYNLRVIVSGAATVNPEAEIFKITYSPVLVLTTGRAPAERVAALRTVAQEVKICGKEEIDFPRALRWLRQKWGVKRLLCEGGGELDDLLFRAGVVDELNLTICPVVLGGRSAPTIADGVGFGKLARAARLKLKSARRHGTELFLVFRRS